MPFGFAERSFWGFLFIGMGCMPLLAQEPDALGQLLHQEEEAARRPYGAESALVSIHGFLNLEFHEFRNERSYFDLHHANLFISGDLTEELQAYIEVEYEHGSETIELDQAEIRFWPGGDRDLTVAGGRFYAPFGIERFTWYPNMNKLVSRPRVFRTVVPGNWYAQGIRTDLQHSMGKVTLRAEAALTNGLGKKANTDIRKAREFRDTDGSRAVTGRLGVAWQDGPGFGVSGSTTNYNGDDRITFLGVDGEYKIGPLLFRGEWVRSWIEDPAGSVGDFMREGYYIEGSYDLWSNESRAEHPSSLGLACRYGVIDENKDIDDNKDLASYTMGIGYTHSHHLVLKAEYQVNDGRHGFLANDGLTLQVVLDF